MNLNEFAQEVHANAVEHGFYDPVPTDAELIAMIHSEVSEALQEYRNNKPMVYHECILDLICDGNGCSDNFDPNEECKYRFPEPRGIAVELIDVVLRILDAAAAWDVNLLDDYWGPYDPDEFANHIRAIADEIVERYTLPELVCELHRLTVELRRLREVGAASELHTENMSFMVGMVYTWLRAHDIDLEMILLEKHRYNQSRPYRHGGKRV